MTENEIRKELDRITDKGAIGEKLTPKETAFLHTEMKKRMTSRKELIEDLKSSLQWEKEHGPGSVSFIPDGTINPETGQIIGTLSEYIHVLEKEEESENEHKANTTDY